MKKFLILLLFSTAFADSDDNCTGNPHHCSSSSGNNNDFSYSNENFNSINPTASSDNSNTNIDNSDFFAFSTSFPNVGECLLGAQGGIKDGDLAGFLGFNQVNDDCWLEKLSEAEKSVELRALLKCDAKKFRNAIAYDQPRKERQKYCIDKVSSIWKYEITKEKEALESCRKNDVCAFVDGKLFHYIDE